MVELGGSDFPAKRERVRLRAEALPAMSSSPQGEVYEEGSSLVGTFFLPFHTPRELKYHVGRRTVTLWSRKAGYEFQTILVLPRWVQPETLVLSYKNGLYEFIMNVAQAPPQTSAGA